MKMTLITLSLVASLAAGNVMAQTAPSTSGFVDNTRVEGTGSALGASVAPVAAADYFAIAGATAMAFSNEKSAAAVASKLGLTSAAVKQQSSDDDVHVLLKDLPNKTQAKQVSLVPAVSALKKQGAVAVFWSSRSEVENFVKANHLPMSIIHKHKESGYCILTADMPAEIQSSDVRS